MKFRKLILVFLAVTLVGCASPNMRYSVPAEGPVASSSNKALVYFLRPQKMGFAISAAVYDDEKFIGFIPYGQKLPYLAEPGEHRFMVVSEAADFLAADLAPGKTYYINVTPRMGAWRARFSMAPITKEMLTKPKIQTWISNARLIDNKENAQEWASKNAESVWEKRTEYLKKWNQKAAEDRPYLKIDDCE